MVSIALAMQLEGGQSQWSAKSLAAEAGERAKGRSRTPGLLGERRDPRNDAQCGDQKAEIIGGLREVEGCSRTRQRLYQLRAIAQLAMASRLDLFAERDALRKIERFVQRGGAIAIESAPAGHPEERSDEDRYPSKAVQASERSPFSPGRR